MLKTPFRQEVTVAYVSGCAAAVGYAALKPSYAGYVVRAPTHSPVRSQSLISPLPDSAVRPSGENATETTVFECPVKVRSSLPVASSQSLSVWSQLPDSAVRPSGEKATDETPPWGSQRTPSGMPCPVKVRSALPV